MRLRTQRLELAFQFVFLLDSSGPSAVSQTAALLDSHLSSQREQTRLLLEAWCSSKPPAAPGVHGDSGAAIQELKAKLTDAFYSMVAEQLQFEADRLPPSGAARGADAPRAVHISDWSDQVRGAFARAFRDHVIASAAREAMEPIFEAAGDVFDDAQGVIAEAALMAQEAMKLAPQTDRITTQLAPTWPPHRQAATDRAILRLGRSEMLAGRTPPKWVVHHCVNLAKRYSTEKSPSFVNALLDKILKQVLAEKGAASTPVADEPQALETELPPLDDAPTHPAPDDDSTPAPPHGIL